MPYCPCTAKSRRERSLQKKDAFTLRLDLVKRLARIWKAEAVTTHSRHSSLIASIMFLEQEPSDADNHHRE